MKYKLNYDWLHCSNKELLKELNKKEYLFAQISERIMRCPYCKKGHFFLEHEDREYSTDAWWMCDNCFECDGRPNKLRTRMIEDIVEFGAYNHWEYTIWKYIQDFEYEKPRTYKENEPKAREFDPTEWDKEGHSTIYDIDKPLNLKWEEFVEKEIKERIICLDKAIERAKKYKILKRFFKEDNNDR